MKNASVPFGIETRQLLQTLIDKGIRRAVVVLRHSVRHYDTDNPINEPFMGLTEEGKQLAYQWGHLLPPEKHLNFFSSFIGRCIETAYLMDKGHVAAGGVTTSNMIELTLSPFYVRDALRLFEQYLKGKDFLSEWFSRSVPPDMIDLPEQVAKTMAGFWEKRLSDNDLSDQIDICITHDWNLYALRWYFMESSPENGGKVDYLDGLIVFKDKNDYFVAAAGHAPVRLRQD